MTTPKPVITDPNTGQEYIEIEQHLRRRRKCYAHPDEALLKALNMLRRGAATSDISTETGLPETAITSLHKLTKFLFRNDEARKLGRAIAGLPNESIMP